MRNPIVPGIACIEWKQGIYPAVGKCFQGIVTLRFFKKIRLRERQPAAVDEITSGLSFNWTGIFPCFFEGMNCRGYKSRKSTATSAAPGVKT